MSSIGNSEKNEAQSLSLGWRLVNTSQCKVANIPADGCFPIWVKGLWEHEARCELLKDELEFVKPRSQEHSLGWKRSPVCKSRAWLEVSPGREQQLNFLWILGAEPSAWEGVANNRCWRNRWHEVECGGIKYDCGVLTTEGKLNGTRIYKPQNEFWCETAQPIAGAGRLWSFISPAQGLILTDMPISLQVNRGRNVHPQSGQFKNDALAHS